MSDVRTPEASDVTVLRYLVPIPFGPVQVGLPTPTRHVSRVGPQGYGFTVLPTVGIVYECDGTEHMVRTCDPLGGTLGGFLLYVVLVGVCL